MTIERYVLVDRDGREQDTEFETYGDALETKGETMMTHREAALRRHHREATTSPAPQGGETMTFSATLRDTRCYICQDKPPDVRVTSTWACGEVTRGVCLPCLNDTLPIREKLYGPAALDIVALPADDEA